MRDIVSQGFYAAGSVVRMDYGETWGLDGPRGIAFFSSGDMVFEPGELSTTGAGGEAGTPHILARFPEEPILLSGYVERDDLVYGKPTALEFSFGQGRIVLIGFSFHNRAQAHAVFPLFFRSLYRWGGRDG